MNIIHNIRLRFHHYFLRRLLKKQKRQTRSGYVNFEEAKAIGILFDATELSVRNIVLEYAKALKKKGKKIQLLGYFDNSTDNPNFTFRHFNKSKTDWALRPKGKEVTRFMKRNFDILINADTETKIYSEYISTLSRAHLKLGPYTENTYCYNLMIEPSDETALKDFLQLAELLLQKTSTRHEAAQI